MPLPVWIAFDLFLNINYLNGSRQKRNERHISLELLSCRCQIYCMLGEGSVLYYRVCSFPRVILELEMLAARWWAAPLTQRWLITGSDSAWVRLLILLAVRFRLSALSGWRIPVRDCLPPPLLSLPQKKVCFPGLALVRWDCVWHAGTGVRESHQIIAQWSHDTHLALACIFTKVGVFLTGCV